MKSYFHNKKDNTIIKLNTETNEINIYDHVMDEIVEVTPIQETKVEVVGADEIKKKAVKKSKGGESYYMRKKREAEENKDSDYGVNKGTGVVSISPLPKSEKTASGLPKILISVYGAPAVNRILELKNQGIGMDAREIYESFDETINFLSEESVSSIVEQLEAEGL